MAPAQHRRGHEDYGAIETSSTLPPSNIDTNQAEGARTAGSTPADQIPRQHPTRWTPLIMVLTMLSIDSLTYIMCLAPQTQLFEDLACRKHYSLSKLSADIPPMGDNPCKIPEVQDTVAQLFGWQAFFDGIPGLLLAMYYGFMADKWGRRPVMLLSKIGMLLAMTWVLMICWFGMPLQFMWLSSLFMVIGGGGTVASAVLMMILTDSTAPDIRSRMFFQTSSILVATELIGPPLASVMMQDSLWLPLTFAWICTIFTTLLAACIPETRPRDTEVETDREREDTEQPAFAEPSKKVSGVSAHVASTLRFIVGDTSIMYLVASFTAVDFARQSLSILLRYVSTRYNISIAKANLLLSGKSFSQLIATAVVLPLLDSLMLKRFALSVKTKDLRLAQASTVFIMLGFAVLIVAPTIWIVLLGLYIYTMGSGFGSFGRSLLSSLVEPRMIGTMFTTLAIMDTLGALLAGPLVAATFSWSLRLDGVLRGAPYIFSLVLCGLATLALLRVKLKDSHEDAGTVGGNERGDFEDEESATLLPANGH